jgi:ribosomal protein S18 acetylase RimI-like enzyme
MWLAETRCVLEICRANVPAGEKMGEIVIRAATPRDLPRVAELAGELVRMHHAVDPARFLLPERVEEGYAWWLERELGRAEAVVIVATIATQIVGYAYGTREGRDWNALLDEHGAIHDVFVAPDARRDGAGRKLVVCLVDELKRRGAPRIVLSTMIANEPAQRLFAACGFRPTMLEMTCS